MPHGDQGVQSKHFNTWSSAGRQHQQPRAAQQNPPIQWSAITEKCVIQYPELRGPDHGPTFDFEMDSKPVCFFDKLFTNKLWDL